MQGLEIAAATVVTAAGAAVINHGEEIGEAKRANALDRATTTVDGNGVLSWRRMGTEGSVEGIFTVEGTEPSHPLDIEAGD